MQHSGPVIVSDEGTVTEPQILRNALISSTNLQKQSGLHLLGTFTQFSMSDNGSYRTLRASPAARNALPTVAGACCGQCAEPIMPPPLRYGRELKLCITRNGERAVG